MKFKKLVTVEEAKKILNSIKINPEIIEIPITEAINRVIAEDIVAPISLPPFTRASMDGYAVKAKDTEGASETSPVLLKVIGSVQPGYTPDIQVKDGSVVEISTGAVLPEGADAVVMVEYTEREGENVKIKRAVGKWENVMKAGADIPEGSLIFTKGTKLDGIKIGVLAGLGIEKVKVWNLRVGLFSTGNEILDISQKLSPGKIYDINSYSLYSILKNAGVTPVILRNLPDDYDIIRERLLRESENYEMLITSGATSAGKGDILYRVIEDEGELLIHGVQIKPGKPFLTGIINETLIIGLPGYPTSALITFNELVLPFIRKIMGERWREWKIRGKILRKIISEGRRQLYPVFVVRDMIFPVDKGSGAITSLSEANGYIEIPEGEEVIERGSEREVKLIHPVTGDLLSVGEDIVNLIGTDYVLKHIVAGAEKTLGMIISGVPDLAVISSEFVEGLEEHVAGKIEVEWGWAGNGSISEWASDTALGVKTGGSGWINQHYQALHELKKGRMCAFLKPFAEKFGIEVKTEGMVEFSVLLNPERKDVEEVKEFLREMKTVEGMKVELDI